MQEQIRRHLSGLIENPPIVPERIELENKTLFLVQEGRMLFGTKQRAMRTFIETIKKEQPEIEEVLYVGGYNASGPAAFAYGALMCNLKCTIIIAYKTEEKLDFFTKSRYKASLNVLKVKLHLVKTYGEARTLADDIRKKSKKGSIYYPIMGFNTPLWRNILSSKIRDAARAGNLHFGKDTTIWITAGTGSVAMSLNMAFPEVNLGLYMTGSEKYQKIIKDWAKNKENVVLIPTLDLEHKPRVPYPTVADYDDYIWPYIWQYAEDGDIIWNIATDDVELPKL